MSRTDLHKRILANSGVLTIGFYKKVDPNKAAKDLWRIAGLSEDFKAFREAVIEAFKGEPRTIVCTHDGEFDTFGRLKVIDMEKNEPRVLDTRTIEWAVIDGVKYDVAE